MERRNQIMPEVLPLPDPPSIGALYGMAGESKSPQPYSAIGEDTDASSEKQKKDLFAKACAGKRWSRLFTCPGEPDATLIDAMKPLIRVSQVASTTPFSIDDFRNVRYREEHVDRSKSLMSRFADWLTIRRAVYICLNIESFATRVFNWGPYLGAVWTLMADNGFSMLYISAVVVMLGQFIWTMLSWFACVAYASKFRDYLAATSAEVSENFRSPESRVEMTRMIKRRTRYCAAFLFCVVMLMLLMNIDTMRDLFAMNEEAWKFVDFRVGFFIGNTYHTLPTWIIFSTLLFAFLHFFVDYTIILLPIVFYVVLCYVISQKFRELTSRLEDEIQETGRIADLGKVRRYHYSLVELTARTDAMFSPFVVLAVVMEILLLVSTVFVAIFGSSPTGAGAVTVGNMKMYDIVSLGVIFYSIVAIMFVYRTWNAVRVHEEAHAIAGPLNRMSFDDLTEAERAEALTILSTVNGPPIGMTVGKFFIIDRSHILTLLSVFATYIVLMIQFKQSE